MKDILRNEIKELIKKLDNKIITNIQSENNIYDVVTFSSNEFGIDSIEHIYGDYFTNSMFVPEIVRERKSYIQKLNLIEKMNIEDGISLWNVVDRKNNRSVGLFGFTYFDNYEKIGLNYGIGIGNLAAKLCEIFTVFAFEYLKLDEFYGEILSYNYFSQHLASRIGMEEDGIIECPSDYSKDDYLILLKITRERYEAIKKQNGGIYKLINIKRDINNPRNLHSKARTIREALASFRDKNQVEKIKHCEELLDYLTNKYPLIYK